MTSYQKLILENQIVLEELDNGKYIFAVGDPLRGYDRLRFVPDAYAAIYGLPKSVFNRMPAWILGFSY